jgi:hypothetical protein
VVGAARGLRARADRQGSRQDASYNMLATRFRIRFARPCSDGFHFRLHTSDNAVTTFVACATNGSCSNGRSAVAVVSFDEIHTMAQTLPV